MCVVNVVELSLAYALIICARFDLLSGDEKRTLDLRRGGVKVAGHVLLHMDHAMRLELVQRNERR